MSIVNFFKGKFLFLLRICFRLFFDKEFLMGRHFESNLSGYAWCVRSIFQKNILRLGKPMPWPTTLTCHVSKAENIYFHPDDLNNFQSSGTYFQNFGALIYIGRGSYIAPNVGIITSNHSLSDLNSHEEGRDVVIGENCWIGMNSVVLPGVVLGKGTVVAAGAVVTKSFPDEGCVIGGIPAKVIKVIAE